MKRRTDASTTLQALVRGSPDPLALLAADGRVDLASKALLHILGRGAREVHRHSLAEWVHPEDWHSLLRSLAATEDHQDDWPRLPIRLRAGDGTWRQTLAGVLRLPPGGRSHLIFFERRSGEVPESPGLVPNPFARVAEQSDDMVIITDRQGIILYVNPSFERLTGYSREEAMGRTPRILKSGLYGPEFYEQFWRTILGGETFRGQMADRKKDGSVFHQEMTVTPILGGNGAITHFVSTGKGLSERMRAEADLRASEERYALAAAGASDGLWDWELGVDRVFYSDRWRAMLGEAEGGEPFGALEDWLNRIHPDDLPTFKARLEAHLRGDTPHFEHEHRVVHRDGRYRWMLARGLAVRDREGRAYRMAGSQTDVTERRVAEERLLYDAMHDALTGLPNRALFVDRLGQAIARASRREGYEFSVLFMDMDRFKVVNDSLGHMTGDQLLVHIARRLTGCLRPADTVARLGGDEFVILLEDIQTATDATLFADRIQKSLKAPFTLDGRDVFITASIGIALSATGYERPADMLRDADIAMYKAKSLGKARSAVFDMSMRSSAVALLELETELRRAVEKTDFRMVYQPIVSLADRRIAGFESLIRWRHPQRGEVPPATFVPLAEETGLIVPIGLWLLRESCRQLRAWQQLARRSRPLTMGVNVSGVQLVQPELITQIDLMLREYGLDGRTLRLEITESVIMERGRYALDVLDQLKAQNIKIAVDGFGTGYSSMSYLRQYPIDTVKIAPSFVARIDQDEESLEIVRAIVTLAHSLKMDVVAENVETERQLELLVALNCEYGQGYYFSPPVERDAAEALLRSEGQG